MGHIVSRLLDWTLKIRDIIKGFCNAGLHANMSWLKGTVLAVFQATLLTFAAPPGFPASGNGLWFTSPSDGWSKTYLPIGNGYLAGM